MACDAQTLVSLAASNKLAGASKRGLDEAIAAQSAQHGGGSAPAAPVSTAATSNFGYTLQSNWNASAGATSYRLDVSTSNVFASFVPGFNNLNVGNVTTYTVTGLTPNTTYYYRLRAVNASGTSGNSNTITTLSFSPIQLPGLFAWYDASDNSTVLNPGDTPCSPGDAVAIWNDKSGNDNTLNNVPGDSPEWFPSTLNGQPGVLFDGAAGIGTAGAVGPNFPFSIFCVGSITTVTGTQNGLIGFQAAMFYCDEPGNQGSITWYGGGATHTQSVGNVVSSGTPFAVGITDDGASTPVLYSDNVALAYDPPTDTGQSAPSDGAIILGCRANDVSFSLSGNIGEVVITSNIMSSGNRAQLQGYFAAKWSA